MAKHVIIVGIIWAVLTAIGWGLASLDLYPTTGSPEAKDFDEIFTFLMYLGMPVLTFVFSILGYGMFRWGHRAAPSDDGPVIYGRGWVPRVWLLITGGLAALVMVTPGLTGLAKMQEKANAYGWGAVEAPLTFAVTAQRFAFSYRIFEEEPGQSGACTEDVQGLLVDRKTPDTPFPIVFNHCSYLAEVLPAPAGQFNEIKLPLGEETKFQIHSIDVLHSFWVPAFRTKIDAVPGRTTFMTVKPDVLGRYADDIAYRVQCAELCGVNHTIMRTRVEVVDAAAFGEWIKSLQGVK